MARKSIAMETPGGAIAEINSNGVLYRHYIISQHALERFQQRAEMTLDNLFVALDRAVIADASRAKDHRIQQQIRKSEKVGYALFDPETDIYFFLAVGPRYHTVCTVMTKELMTYVS